MSKANSNPRSLKQLAGKHKAQLAALAKLPETEINTKAIPEARDWSGAKRGLFYRPVKKQLTLWLDADVVAWFKEHTAGTKATKRTSTAPCANMSNGANARRSGSKDTG